jgi:hypothetical protein
MATANAMPDLVAMANIINAVVCGQVIVNTKVFSPERGTMTEGNIHN